MVGCRTGSAYFRRSRRPTVRDGTGSAYLVPGSATPSGTPAPNPGRTAGPPAPRREPRVATPVPQARHGHRARLEPRRPKPPRRPGPRRAPVTGREEGPAQLGARRAPQAWWGSGPVESSVVRVGVAARARRIGAALGTVRLLLLDEVPRPSAPETRGTAGPVHPPTPTPRSCGCGRRGDRSDAPRRLSRHPYSSTPTVEPFVELGDLRQKSRHSNPCPTSSLREDGDCKKLRCTFASRFRHKDSRIKGRVESVQKQRTTLTSASSEPRGGHGDWTPTPGDSPTSAQRLSRIRKSYFPKKGTVVDHQTEKWTVAE